MHNKASKLKIFILIYALKTNLLAVLIICIPTFFNIYNVSPLKMNGEVFIFRQYDTKEK